MNEGSERPLIPSIIDFPPPYVLVHRVYRAGSDSDEHIFTSSIFCRRYAADVHHACDFLLNHPCPAPEYLKIFPRIVTASAFHDLNTYSRSRHFVTLGEGARICLGTSSRPYYLLKTIKVCHHLSDFGCYMLSYDRTPKQLTTENHHEFGHHREIIAI